MQTRARVADILGNTVLVPWSPWSVLRRVSPLIAAEGYHVEEASSWSRLLDPRFSSHDLSGVLLGENGEAFQEMAILSRFRERSGALGVPVILVGGMNAILRADKFRAAGADAVVPADVTPEALLEQARPLLRYGSLYQSLSNAHRDLRGKSLLDELTGMPNRRLFSLDLARNVEMARRTGRPLSCVVVDIDDFRKIGELHGPPASDGVIRQFGAVIGRAKRGYDTVARLGVDEFGWLMVDADPPRAIQAAERAQKMVRENVFEAAPETTVRLTATFGVSSIVPGSYITADNLVENADRALYWGKESGKNVVRFYPPRKG